MILALGKAQTAARTSHTRRLHNMRTQHRLRTATSGAPIHVYRSVNNCWRMLMYMHTQKAWTGSIAGIAPIALRQSQHWSPAPSRWNPGNHRRRPPRRVLSFWPPVGKDQEAAAVLGTRASQSMMSMCIHRRLYELIRTYDQRYI